MNYFKDALGNFTFDAACGGAIRHLADLGYTAGQIVKQLDYPASYDKVREVYTSHLLEQGILLREEPGSGAVKERYRFVREQDAYGRASFRKIVLSGEEKPGELCWKSVLLQISADGVWLKDLAERSKKEDAYVRCIFTKKDILNQDLISCLEPGQIEYLDGIMWQKGVRYHRVNERMQGILMRLAENYRGKLQFFVLEEERASDA